MKIALIQMSMNSDINQNLRKSLKSMEKAAKKKVDIVIFPELQLSPFFPQHSGRDVEQYLLTLDSSQVKALQSKSADLKLISIPNIYLQENSGRYDACPVIDHLGRIVGVSKMVHVVQTEQFNERDYYTPSDEGFKVYNTKAGKIGVVICFDRHYPESIRSCVLQGAQLIVIPTAIVRGEPLELFEWEVRLAAWQNNIFIAICNRVGIEDEMNFCGGSMVVDPDGEIIAGAGDRETVLFADLDYQRIEKSRRERQFLALRRPDHYLN